MPGCCFVRLALFPRSFFCADLGYRHIPPCSHGRHPGLWIDRNDNDGDAIRLACLCQCFLHFRRGRRKERPSTHRFSMLWEINRDIGPSWSSLSVATESQLVSEIGYAHRSLQTENALVL